MPEQPWVQKTGLEVLELPDGTWGVDLLDGGIGIFHVRAHAEQFIFQQNTVWRISREHSSSGTS